MRGKLLILLFGLIFLPGQILGVDPVSLIAPGTLNIQTHGGTGELNFIIKLNSVTQLPDLRSTDAVSNYNNISRDFIRVESVDDTTLSKDPSLKTLKIKVETKAPLDPNADYNGKLLFIVNGATQSIPFSIREANNVDFNIVLPKSINTALLNGQSNHREIMITNSGQESITCISFSSLNLEDQETHRRIEFTAQESGNLDLKPGQQANVPFEIPQPINAGSYAGDLNIVVNHRTTKSISLTVKNRGPNWWGDTQIPFILFTSVFFIGYAISLILDQWFEKGGLTRARTRLEIAQAKDLINQTIKQLQLWSVNPVLSLKFPLIEHTLQNLLGELDQLSAKPDLAKPITTEFVTKLKTIALGADLLCRTTDGAIPKITPDDLLKLVAEYDQLPLPQSDDQLTKYREDLQSLLEKYSGTSDLRKNADADKVSIVRKLLQLLIWLMPLLRWSVVAVVVFSTAFSFYYLNHLDFGTPEDYFTVFFYSLGLSTTGHKIMNEIPKPGT